MRDSLVKSFASETKGFIRFSLHRSTGGLTCFGLFSLFCLFCGCWVSVCTLAEPSSTCFW